MKQKKILKFTWIVFSGLALGLSGCDAKAPQFDSKSIENAESKKREGPPNLILITLDTTRADALGSYGQTRGTSPHIDQLGEEGVVFERAVTTNPETLPAHASIFTGLWPHRHGVRANAGFILSNSQRTLAEILRDSGYRTATEIAAPVLRKETQIAQGFNHYRDALSRNVKLKKLGVEHGAAHSLTRTGSDITERAVAFMERYRDEPFFLWLHYFDAHDPYYAPEEFRKRFKDSPYHAEVAYLDAQIGALRKALDELELEDETIVILTSDHGEGLNEHNEPTHSFFVYDSTMKVPLILWAPSRAPKGTRVPSLVRTVDILPTVLDLLGIEPVRDVDGRSLIPLFQGAAPPDPRPGYGEASRFAATFGLPTLRSLTLGDWKYIHKTNPELYFIREDPSELINRAEQEPEQLAFMQAQLKALLDENPSEPEKDSTQRELDSQVAAELIALGYVAHAPKIESDSGFSVLDLYGEDPNVLVDEAEKIAIAQGYLRSKRPQRALDILKPVRERTPNSAYVIGLTARAMSDLGRVEEALATYQDLLSIEPCDYPSRAKMAEILREKQLWSQLLVLLEDGIETCPSDKANINDLAWALATLPEAGLRDGPRARSIMDRIVSQGSQKPQAAYLDTLAAVYAENGDFAQAIIQAKRALEALHANNAPEAIIQVVQEHLDQYRSQQPMREPALP